MSKAMEMIRLDMDQKLILGIYDQYSNEEYCTYLQYTAACVIFFYLTQKKTFNYHLEAPLVYDYLEGRRYIWEDKKFMSDINIIRSYNFLMRARPKSNTNRDVNAHQCTKEGHMYIEDIRQSDGEFALNLEKALLYLKGERGHLMQVKLYPSGPELQEKNRIGKVINSIKVLNFLKDTDFRLDENISLKSEIQNLTYSPYLINENV